MPNVQLTLIIAASLNNPLIYNYHYIIGYLDDSGI